MPAMTSELTTTHAPTPMMPAPIVEPSARPKIPRNTIPSTGTITNTSTNSVPISKFGEMLAGAILPDANPFLHDRRKTFQPRDWWEWLLKLAVILFVLDVGLRRIQIERDQWQKAMVRVKQKIFFWKGVPRPAEADVSLAALLSRRDEA